MTMENQVKAFMQARGIAASALSDMAALLGGGEQGAMLACSAMMQIIADEYRRQGLGAEDARQTMHHSAEVAATKSPQPLGRRWP